MKTVPPLSSSISLSILFVLALILGDFLHPNHHRL